MKEIKLLYSHWIKDTPYEFYLVNPSEGEIYYTHQGDFVKWKALIKVNDKTFRSCYFSLPLNQIAHAIKRLSYKSKHCELLRLVLIKRYGGRIEIKEHEIIK